MGMEAAHGIAPQESGEAIGGEHKRGRTTLGSGGHLPIRVRIGIAHPLIKLVDPYRVRSVIVISNDGGYNDCHAKDRKQQETFGHRAGLYLFPL
jgi:hypothetical protein